MIGFNPTPELKNYSHIIIANIKANIFKQNSNFKLKVNSRNNVTVAKFRVETILSSRNHWTTAATNEKPKLVSLVLQLLKQAHLII